MNEIKRITMTEDEFYEKFHPKMNRFFQNPEDCPFGGAMYETYGREEKHIDTLAQCPNCQRSVWTIIEAEGNMYYVSGWHFVNRFGYIVTEELVEEGLEIEVLLETNPEE